MSTQKDAEKALRYQRVHAFLRKHRDCLVRGMTGAATAAACLPEFDAIPEPLRGVLLRDVQRGGDWKHGMPGGALAYKRLHVDGPLEEIVNDIYRRAAADPAFMERSLDAWQCMVDGDEVQEADDREGVPGEAADENLIPVRWGGFRSNEPVKSGAPTSKFVFPTQEGDAPAGGGEPPEESIPPDLLPDLTDESANDETGIGDGEGGDV